MNISEDTKNIIKALDYISGNKLRKRKDIAALIELCATYHSPKILDDLVFTGAALWNLHSKMRKEQISDEAAELIQKELLRHIHKIKEKMESILEKNEVEGLEKRFEEIYFVQTQGALKNIIDLSFDLKMFKELQNQNKRM